MYITQYLFSFHWKTMVYNIVLSENTYAAKKTYVFQ
jgi:hypothetical protein